MAFEPDGEFVDFYFAFWVANVEQKTEVLGQVSHFAAEHKYLVLEVVVVLGHRLCDLVQSAVKVSNH